MQLGGARNIVYSMPFSLFLFSTNVAGNRRDVSIFRLAIDY